ATRAAPRRTASAAGVAERAHELVLVHLAASAHAERLRALVKLGFRPAFELVVAAGFPAPPAAIRHGLALLGLQATLQDLHQVDDLGLFLLFLGDGRPLDVDAALELTVDQRAQFRRPRVDELRSVDLVGRKLGDHALV